MRICEMANKLDLSDDCSLYRKAKAGVIAINVGFIIFLIYIILGMRYDFLFLSVFLGVYGMAFAVFLKINKKYGLKKAWKLRVQELAFIELSLPLEILLGIIGGFFLNLSLERSAILDRITYYFITGLILLAIMIITVQKRIYGVSVARNYEDSKERFIKLRHRLSIDNGKNFVDYGELKISFSEWENEIRIYHVENNIEEAKKIMKIVDSL